jgi:hypothetical protein
MIPAPITISFFGTAASDSAPVEVYDLLLIDLDARQRRRFRAGGDDDVLRGQRGLRAVRPGHRDLAGPGDGARALHPVDLVLLEQELDALGQLTDALGLLGQHLLQVQLRRDVDADPGEILRRQLEQLRGVQQRLGRHAADVQAGAAQGRAAVDPLVHAGDLQAQLARPDRGVVAAGSASDDHDVIGGVSHGALELEDGRAN